MGVTNICSYVPLCASVCLLTLRKILRGNMKKATQLSPWQQQPGAQQQPEPQTRHQRSREAWCLSMQDLASWRCNSSFTSQFALFGIQTEPGVTGFHPNSQTDSLCCYSPCFRKSLCWCREARPCFRLSAAPLGSGTISLVSLLCACFQGVCFPPPFYQNCECRWYPSSCKHCSHFSSSSAPHDPIPGFTLTGLEMPDCASIKFKRCDAPIF